MNLHIDISVHNNMLFSLLVIFGFVIQTYLSSRSAAVYNEEECLREGGVCGPVQFCPQEDRKPGLCPKQQSKGIDCCATMPSDPNDKTCGRRGGECTTQNCGNSVEKDSVCPPGQRCCIWL